MWWKPMFTARGTGFSLTLSKHSPAISSTITNRQIWITKWLRKSAGEGANRFNKQTRSLCKRSVKTSKGPKIIQLKKKKKKWSGYKWKRMINCCELKISKPKKPYSTENLNWGWNCYFPKLCKRTKRRKVWVRRGEGGEARRYWRQFNLSWNFWIE